MNKIRVSVLTPSIRMEGLNVVQKGLERQTFPADSFEWLTELGLVSQGHTLNQSYNRMLKRAKGELIVSLQDYILIQPDYLQKWWDEYIQTPNTFFTAPVGKTDKTYTNPVWDWRYAKRTFKQCNWNEWEIDSGAAPLRALKQIGGFDEALDGTWSGDNVNVGKRAFLAGYDFEVINNPALVYDHDKDIPHPYRDTYNATLNTKRMALFEGGMTLPPIA